MAEALISAVLKQLVSLGSTLAQQEVKLVLGVENEINSLTTMFNILKQCIEDAEESQIMSKGVKAWLEDVKDIAYRTDDVLDEWNTKLLQNVASTENSLSVNKNKHLLPFRCSFFCIDRAVVRHEIGHKIKSLKRRLNEAIGRVDLLQLNPKEYQNDFQLGRPTTSFVVASSVVGRDSDKEQILEWVYNINNQLPLDVAAIVGTGGFGKTALAQLILGQVNVKATFESLMWIYVSDYIDIRRIVKDMIELITKVKPTVDSLEALLQCLSESIKGKSFLLILDDVWATGLRQWWDPLKNSLYNGASDSKIIITTRCLKVAKMMRSSFVHNLHQLSDNDGWLIFKQIAFFDILPHERLEFERIGREIVIKCKGVPLAIKTIASLLQLKQAVGEWQSILDSSVWEYVAKDMLPALLLSYYDFPPQLKQCFLYCAIFPKDMGLRKEILVRLWMAQGFLGSEMDGEECFNELVMRCFIRDWGIDNSGEHMYMMHDLVHDFAKSLTRTECRVLETVSKDILRSNVRHLTVSKIENPNVSKVNKNLRTLIVFSLEDSTNVSKLFRKLTYLRTLDLSGSYLKELPNEVELLIHLRYLDVLSAKLTKLPESLCNLCNLQTLSIIACHGIHQLPDRFGELSNLRHFNFEGVWLDYFPKGFGKLSCLQTLTRFIVGGETGGCPIRELGNINHLRGLLEIEGLWQVDVKEAQHARLQEKKDIDKLVLDFGVREDRGVSVAKYTCTGDRRNSRKMEGVLEGLQAHNNLKELTIVFYPGSTVNLERDGVLKGLHILSLKHCKNLKALPGISEIQFLESLTIVDVDDVGATELLKSSSGVNGESSSSSPTLFPNLKTLSLKKFPEWEEHEKIEETITKTVMPCLLSLDICYCPKLKVAPYYMFSQTLKKLSLSNCPGLSGMQPCLPPLLETLFLMGDVGVLSSSLMPIIHNNNYPNLKCVTIQSSQISSLPQGLIQFTSLQKLELKVCNLLDFNPEVEFRHWHPSLTITILSCPLLKEHSSRENWSNSSNFPRIIFQH